MEGQTIFLILQVLQEKGDGQLRKSMQFSIPGLLDVE